MSDDQPTGGYLYGIDLDPPTCPDCAALQARLRTLDAKLAAARLALAACRDVREARERDV